MTTRTTTQARGYNASVIERRNGETTGVFAAYVEHGMMLRSNWLQCTGLEGSEAYDAYLRAGHPEYTFIIREDNGAAYLAAVRGQRPTLLDGEIAA